MLHRNANIIMQTIGLMMVVRNEAHRLHEFFKHTLPYVDAVCVCDQQSDDDTWQILLSYKAHSPIKFDVWQDKQYGISEPSKQPTAQRLDTDWLLYLDPDELLDPVGLKELHNLIENDKIDGYLFARKNIFIVKVFGDNTPLEPKVLEVTHPARDDQLRLTRKSLSFFPPQIHVRVRVKREDKQEYLSHSGYEIIHKKTIQEQFDDDRRYKEPVEKVKQQIKDGTVTWW